MAVKESLSKDEYIRALTYAFYSLYFVVKNKGVAMQLKSEFMSLKNELPDWLLHMWGIKKDYNMGSYDSGDPIELAMKILGAWWMSWKYIVFGNTPSKRTIVYRRGDMEHIFNISKMIIMDSIYDNPADVETYKVAAQWAALISWSGYDFDVSDVVEKIKDMVAEGEDAWIDFVVYGRGDRLSRVISDYTSWIPLKGVVG